MVQNKNHMQNNILAIIAILVIMALGYFIYVTQIAPATSTVIKTMPVMRQSLVSESDGSEHTVDVKFSVEFPRKLENKIDMKAVEGSLKNSLQNISYSKLKEPNSVDYVRNIAKDELSKILTPEQFEEVYIGDIAVDFPIVDDTPSGNNFMKGIFKSMD